VNWRESVAASTTRVLRRSPALRAGVIAWPNRGAKSAGPWFFAFLRESRLEQSNGVRRPRPPQSLTKKVRTARPNQLTIAAGRKLKIEAVKTSPSKNIRNAMPPTSRIAPIIKAARNATVPSIRSRYGRVVERGMRQNAYGTQNKNMSHHNHTLSIDGEPLPPRRISSAPPGRFEERIVYQGMCWGTMQVAAVLVLKRSGRSIVRKELICER
jgi:hypothetical protein